LVQKKLKTKESSYSAISHKVLLIFHLLSLDAVLYVFNKIDALWIEELDILDRLDNVVPSKLSEATHSVVQPLGIISTDLSAHLFSLFRYLSLVSSQHKWNLEELMEEIWDRTNMLRIYPKVCCSKHIRFW
jgi:ribosome-interacting GTPase 1